MRTATDTLPTARHWEPLADGAVRCTLCPHDCVLKPGRYGICGVRANDAGRLVTLVYGRVAAMHVDPIEKKPLSHFHPGSRSMSFATIGCNLRCTFCQNATISQVSKPFRHPGQKPDGSALAVSPELEALRGRRMTPEAIVDAAEAAGARSIAYTYTEPTIFYEIAHDTAHAAHARGIANVFVTNGFTNPAPLREIAPVLDAANVDLKGFRDWHYRKVTGSRLAPVLDTLRLYRALGIWLEVTTLVIPELNDSDAELRDCARFIATELGPEVPWHVSAFHPDFQMRDRGRTPPATLARAWEIGRAAGLRYVFVGNLPGHDGEHTDCHGCGARLIARRGYVLLANRVRGGACPDCGTPVAGVALDGEDA